MLIGKDGLSMNECREILRQNPDDVASAIHDLFWANERHQHQIRTLERKLSLEVDVSSERLTDILKLEKQYDELRERYDHLCDIIMVSSPSAWAAHQNVEAAANWEKLAMRTIKP